ERRLFAFPRQPAYCVDEVVQRRLSLRQSRQDIRDREAGEPRLTGFGDGAGRPGSGPHRVGGADRFAGGSWTANLATVPRRKPDDDPGHALVPTEAVAIVPLMDSTRATAPPVITLSTEALACTWLRPLVVRRGNPPRRQPVTG